MAILSQPQCVKESRPEPFAYRIHNILHKQERIGDRDNDIKGVVCCTCQVKWIAASNAIICLNISYIMLFYHDYHKTIFLIVGAILIKIG